MGNNFGARSGDYGLETDFYFYCSHILENGQSGQRV